jgi:uncharacterized membrane protein
VTGFVVFVPANEALELDMEVDAAFKMLVSFGVVVPTWNAEDLAELPVKESAGTADSGL